MLKLHEIQQQFMQGLYDPNAVTAAEFIQPSSKQSASERLQSYRHSLIGHLSQVLSEIYPVCLRLLGQTFFERLSLRYINEHPSKSLNVNDYGEQFAEFIQAFPPLIDYAYIADVARLEWHWHRAFHGEDQAPLNIEALNQLDKNAIQNLHFRLPAASALLESAYPIQAIWAANQAEHSEVAPVDLDQGGVKLFVWRQGLDMRIDLLSDEEWWFLNAIAEDKAFPALCDQLLEQHPSCDTASLAPHCVEQGYINDFQLKPCEV